MRVKIEGKNYEVKTLFGEYKIKDLIWANRILRENDMSPRFCMKLLKETTNIPVEVLEILDFESEIKVLAEMSLIGLRTPDIDVFMDYVQVDGVKYYKREELLTLSGIKVMFGKNNFKQFALMGQLHDILARNKEVDPTNLASLVAVLYGDDFSDKAIEERAKKFMDLDLYSAFSGFFLFQREWNKFLNCLSVYSQTRVQALLSIERLQRRLLKTIFGFLLPLRWRSWEFLINLTKRL